MAGSPGSSATPSQLLAPSGGRSIVTRLFAGSPIGRHRGAAAAANDGGGVALERSAPVGGAGAALRRSTHTEGRLARGAEPSPAPAAAAPGATASAAAAAAVTTIPPMRSEVGGGGGGLGTGWTRAPAR
jgi:hypothetical protein